MHESGLLHLIKQQVLFLRFYSHIKPLFINMDNVIHLIEDQIIRYAIDK